MDKRLELHEELCGILGSRNAYFQPPESVKMKYPAIVYVRKVIENIMADNRAYKQNWGYEVTHIDKDPDSENVKKLSQLPYCRYDRHFIADNLHHDVFTLYRE